MPPWRRSKACQSWPSACRDAEALGARGIEATNVMGMVSTGSLQALAAMLERGEIDSPEISSFSLANAGRALAALATGHTRGKIIVTP